MIFNNYLSVEETENQCHNGALQKKKSNSLKSHCLICHISMTWKSRKFWQQRKTKKCLWWSMPRYIVTMDTYLERIEEHFKVKFDQFRFIAHTVRQAHKHDIMDPKQRNQNQGGLGQLSKTFKFKKNYKSSSCFSLVCCFTLKLYLKNSLTRFIIHWMWYTYIVYKLY